MPTPFTKTIYTTDATGGLIVKTGHDNETITITSLSLDAKTKNAFEWLNNTGEVIGEKMYYGAPCIWLYMWELPMVFGLGKSVKIKADEPGGLFITINGYTE